eukprot:gene16616-22859_t
MGCSTSKEERSFLDNSESLNPEFSNVDGDGGQQPTTGPLTAKDYKARLTTSEGTQTIYYPTSGYTIRYAYVTQRGLYPDSLDKANQDSLCVHTFFGGDPEQALFGVFDGHGEYGTQCSQYAKDKVPENLLNNAQFVVSPESAYHRAMTNTQLHRLPDVDDSMSGTTAIACLLRGRHIYTANVGDSRCVLAEQTGDKLVAHDLSFDQTPFRRDECERVKRCGARVLTLDQLEGLKDPNVEHWGTEEDNDGDPPRLWAPNATYPGTAFTRSIGDSAAERIGVFAEPEVVSRQLTSHHPFLVIASDGVWEFLPSQSVIDMVSKFEDPHEACLSVVAESYRLWLQHETRTDDITMMVLQFSGLEDEPPPMALPTPMGALLDYSTRPPPGPALRRMKTARVAAVEVPSASFSSRHDILSVPQFGESSRGSARTPEELQSLEEAVRNNFLFLKLEEAQRREMFETFEKRPVKGEPGDHYYIVEAGHFDVYLQHSNAKHPELVHTYMSQAGQKASFGELALMYSKPRAATVIARTEGMLWCLHRNGFKGVLQRAAKDVDYHATVQTLRSVEVLQCLSMSHLYVLAEAMQEVSYSKGEYIIRQGEEGRDFFLIHSGEVVCTVRKNAENVDEAAKEVLRLSTGQYFGDAQLLVVSRHRFEHVIGSLQEIINCEAIWKDQLALQRELLARKNTTSAKIIQGNFSLDDLIVRGLLFSTDCSAMMLMEHKESEEIFTVRITCVSDVVAMNKQGLVLRAREITRSIEPSFFVPGILKSFKDSRVLAEMLMTVGLCTLDMLLHPQPFDPLSSMFVAASVVLGLEHLHWSQVIYRGLSAHSIIITEGGQVQLVDFRFARKNSERAYTLCGNPEYLAPEVIMNKGHSEAVDLWSLGVLIYYLLAGETPFAAPGDDELRIYRKIITHQIVFPPHFSPLECDLIEQLLQKEPSKRLGYGPYGLGDIKAHPWFSGIDWEALLEHRNGYLATPLRPPSPPGVSAPPPGSTHAHGSTTTLPRKFREADGLMLPRLKSSAAAFSSTCLLRSRFLTTLPSQATPRRSAKGVRPTTSMASAKVDHSSLSNFKSVRVTHSVYELDVDFTKKIIEGYAKLDAVVEEDGASELVVDTRDLTIHGVFHVVEGDGGKHGPLSHAFGEANPVLGTPLQIPLPSGLTVGQKLSVGVRFTTATTCTAMQFLEPSQTAGGKAPYLFTQCQAIHARSLVPCQDTPGAKTTYEAVVRVPKELTALMSAVPVEGEKDVPHLCDITPSGDTRTFAFTQSVPIPPYLLALAVGDLECRELSPRSRVWSEPSMVEAGAYEFAETAKFLDAGEAIAGEYVWGRYDLLLLPPSFPYGGMENPCLTFVTPTLLAGDRSLTNVVAHEIAHSWCGNLVTNATWEHFWLNEGFTVFLERKILGRLHGPATLQYHAANGAIFLAEDVKRFGEDHPYTRLVPDLSAGIDPDDVFSKVPYEKGFYFLYYLEQCVGGAEVFEPFFKAYLNNFKFKSLTSDDFKAFFLQYFKDVPEAQKVDFDSWFYSTGMPPATNTYDTSLAQAAYELAKQWHTCDVMGLGAEFGPKRASSKDVEGWSSEQLVTFLDKLLEYRSLTPMHATTTKCLAKMYNLYSYQNAEIRCAFYRLAIPAEDEEVLPHAIDLVTKQGRMKFLRSIYRALMKSKMGKKAAVDTYEAAKASYHPIAVKMVAADLGLDK